MKNIELRYCPHRQGNIPLEVVYNIGNGTRTEQCMVPGDQCACRFVKGHTASVFSPIGDSPAVHRSAVSSIKGK